MPKHQKNVQLSNQEVNQLNSEAISNGIISMGSNLQVVKQKQPALISEKSNCSNNLSSYGLSSIKKMCKKLSIKNNSCQEQNAKRYQRSSAQNQKNSKVEDCPSIPKSLNKTNLNEQAVSILPITVKIEQKQQQKDGDQVEMSLGTDLSLLKRAKSVDYIQTQERSSEQEKKQERIYGINCFQKKGKEPNNYQQNEEQFSFFKCLEIQPVLQNMRASQRRYLQYSGIHKQKSKHLEFTSTTIGQNAKIKQKSIKYMESNSYKKHSKLILF